MIVDLRSAYTTGLLALGRQRGLGNVRQIDHDTLAALLEATRGFVAGENLPWNGMDAAPAVEDGRELRVLCCWRNNNDHSQVASGEVYYLNRVRLDWDDDAPAALLNVDGTVTGWFERYEGSEGGVMFQPVRDQFVTHLGWAYMPLMPAALHG